MPAHTPGSMGGHGMTPQSYLSERMSTLYPHEGQKVRQRQGHCQELQAIHVG